MKKSLSCLILLTLFACNATKDVGERPLHEILIQKPTGGAQVRFYEILSEPDEFVMIKNDPDLKSKVGPNDITTANFLILSAGEKPTGGYAIGVKSVEETANSVIVTVQESEPAPGAMVTMSMTTPFCVVRINSKKEIIFQ